MNPKILSDFIKESNRIEGIHRPPVQAELDAFKAFLELPVITVADLERLVNVFQPNASLRDKPGLNVKVGNHFPPLGGPKIKKDLIYLLLNCTSLGAFKTHLVYETLHPFTDGNGRSGRALWAWQMKIFPLGFLHHFYYQTLQNFRP